MKAPYPWRQCLRTNFTKLKDLLDFLECDTTNRALCLDLPPFPLNVPRRLASLMAKNDPTDPIFLQFVPLKEEARPMPGFVTDPVEDGCFTKTKKLLHKYPSRVLLLTTSACAMHCRFCFRQNFPYESYDKCFDEELDYIAANPSLSEVILSGGDPLSLPTKTLEPLLLALDKIPHVKLIRFHTRFLIGIPERVTNHLLTVLKNLSKKVTMVLHINHPKEVTSELCHAIDQLKAAGASLLSQSVLLNSVNADKLTLKALFEAITYAGIIPYYLHRLDRVKGSHHFVADEEKAKIWLEELRDEMPGYAVPRFVAEIPHKESKTLLSC